VKQTSLTRRLLAGAAGLAIGAVGALALVAPAQAEETEGQIETYGFKKSSVEFLDDCDGTTVTVTSGKVLKKYKWTVSVDGAEFDKVQLGKEESADFFVPSDAGEVIEVDFKYSPAGWPKTHTWTEPEDCEVPEEPEEPEVPLEGSVASEFDCETITLSITLDTDEAVTFAVVPSVGDAVEVTVEGNSTSDGISFPASEGLTIDLQVEGESVLEEPIEITSEDWAELGCDEEGEGGELPVTGSSTLLIAGGALALLALGGGMFMVARRRRGAARYVMI
jgi:LPXTG-motif cell wall-anchored protein